mmetsp:Transcript_47794/g.64813  ORF Transcript_47794/g.64813 Transcript_47794/m.64813 type:complete len:247 (+) Transcript_47794:509-1249(+)
MLIHANIPWLVLLCDFGDLVPISHDFTTESAEFVEPSFTDSFTRHSSLECILSKSSIFSLVLESADSSLNCECKVLSSEGFECVTTAGLAVPHELDYGILKTTSLKGNNWSATDKEFVLHNTTGFEHTGHEAEVGTSVNKSTISKELIRCSPEAVRIFIFKVPHLLCAISTVWISHIGWATDNEVDFVVHFMYNSLSNVEDQMNTLLFSNSTNEGEQGSFVIKLLELEVFLLQHSLCSNVIRGGSI